MAIGSKFGDARTDEPKVQKRRRGAGAAVEDESHGSCRRTLGLGNVSRVEDGGRSLTRLIEQGKGSGRRRVVELAGWERDAVLGDSVCRQQRKHAGSVLGAVVLTLPVGAIVAVPRVVLSGGSRARGGNNSERNQQTTQMKHTAHYA